MNTKYYIHELFFISLTSTQAFLPLISEIDYPILSICLIVKGDPLRYQTASIEYHIWIDFDLNSYIDCLVQSSSRAKVREHVNVVQ